VIDGVVAVPFTRGTVNKILTVALLTLTRTTPVGVPVPDPEETAILRVCAEPTGIVVLDTVTEVVDDKPVTVS
jgi:hypothetical protein